jgi:hypothetical protein
MYPGRIDGGVTMKDPIVEEVRCSRKAVEHAASKKGLELGAYYMERQRRYKGGLIVRKPQKALKVKIA